MTDAETQRKDDIDALVLVVNAFREEQERQRRDIDRAQQTATFACLYGKRISEHMGVKTSDVDDMVRARDPELAKILGLTPPEPKHDPEAETDPFAAP